MRATGASVIQKLALKPFQMATGSQQSQLTSRLSLQGCDVNSSQDDQEVGEEIATGVPRLPLDAWLEEALQRLAAVCPPSCMLPMQVKLHSDLAKDIKEKFGSVPQQERAGTGDQAIPPP